MLKYAIFHAGAVGSASVLPFVSAAILLGSPAVSGAQEGGNVSVDVGDCVKLESRADRLACYDRRANEALSERDRSAGDAGSAGSAASAVGRTSTEAAPDEHRSGFPNPTEQPGAAAEGNGEFHGTISALRKRLPNQYLITLENGQVWLQMPPQRYPLQIGDEVRIYPTHWGGAYRLTVEKLRGFIQVERVR